MRKFDMPDPKSPATSECTTKNCGSSCIEVNNLSVHSGAHAILRDLSLEAPRNQVLGIVGPSGVGKSTLLRAMNRLLDLLPGFRVSGSVLLNGENIYAPNVDGNDIRTRVGMLFQQPVVFPASIAENVLFGIRHHRALRRSEKQDIVESRLKQVALWEETRDRLKDPASKLSVGQQQRLCLARTLAVRPEVILMDEPTSALDARSTESIEHLMTKIKAECTIVLVTHNLDQARRVTDWVACLCPKDGAGEVLESACCDAFFSSEACLKVFERLEMD
jgi:phosphate transport system ATP-binding protein